MTVVGQRGMVSTACNGETEFNSVGIPGLHFHRISAEAVITLVFAFHAQTAPRPSAAFNDDYFPPGGSYKKPFRPRAALLLPVRLHRTNQFRAASDTELMERTVDVSSDRRIRNAQPECDFLVEQSLHHQPDHIPLSRRQVLQHVL